MADSSQKACHSIDEFEPILSQFATQFYATSSKALKSERKVLLLNIAEEIKKAAKEQQKNIMITSTQLVVVCPLFVYQTKITT